MVLVESLLIEVILSVKVGVLWESIDLILLRGLEVGCSERLRGGEGLGGIERSGGEGIGVDRRVKA